MKEFLKPTRIKVLLTFLSFIFFNVFFFVCSPLEYETFGYGNAMGRHLTYSCGQISRILLNMRGSAWTRNYSFDWIIYLIVSYLIASLSVLLINKHNKKNSNILQ